MATFHAKLRTMVPKTAVPPTLELLCSMTCLELEDLVSTYEGTALGKWKMVLMPLSDKTRPPKRSMQELQEEVNADESLETVEQKQAALRKLIVENNKASTTTPVALTVADATLASFGILPGETRTLEVILDFGSCHMDRSLKMAKAKGKTEAEAEACRRDATGQCSCLDEV